MQRFAPRCAAFELNWRACVIENAVDTGAISKLGWIEQIFLRCFPDGRYADSHARV
jgi:hypothetical protein